MGIYAPDSDNNDSKNYANFVATELGVDVNTPINQLDSKDLARAITKFESPQMYKLLYG